jgi:uncharacterized membrane protein
LIVHFILKLRNIDFKTGQKKKKKAWVDEGHKSRSQAKVLKERLEAKCSNKQNFHVTCLLT